MLKISKALLHKRPIVSAIRTLSLATVVLAGGGASAEEQMPNSCPIDGCIVKIIAIANAGDELELTLESNFTPDVAKNHFHVWWGEQYTVKQVGRNAKSAHGVEQGRWHRHDDYPKYVTKSAASTGMRDSATTICVTAADRGHNVLDATLYQCVDARSRLN